MNDLASATIMRSLLMAAPPKRKETLARLQIACDDLAARGQFRLRDIERRVAERFGKEFGPRAQTISNEKTLELGMYHYVEARRREASASSGLRRGMDAASIPQRIDRLADIDLRNVMRDVYDRMLSAEAADRRSKHVLKTCIPGVDVEGLLEGTVRRPQSLFETSEIAALKQLRAILSDAEKLADCGLQVIEGSICRRGGLRSELIAASTMKSFFDICAKLEQL